MTLGMAIGEIGDSSGFASAGPISSQATTNAIIALTQVAIVV